MQKKKPFLTILDHFRPFRPFWPFLTIFDHFRIFFRSFWHQRIYDTTLGSRDIAMWRFLWEVAATAYFTFIILHFTLFILPFTFQILQFSFYVYILYLLHFSQGEQAEKQLQRSSHLPNYLIQSLFLISVPDFWRILSNAKCVHPSKWAGVRRRFFHFCDSAVDILILFLILQVQSLQLFDE